MKPLIREALGAYLKPGMQYHSPLPEALKPWYCYTLDGGHSILAVLKQHYDQEGKAGDVDPRPHFLPVPVKTTLRSCEVKPSSLGPIVVVDAPYSSDFGLDVPEGDDEF